MKKHRPLSVLIVEDDPDARDILSAVLEDRGCEVVAARHGEDALERLRALHPHRPDAIILDLMMPVMDGLEFLRRRAVDACLREIPVLVLSAVGGRVPAAGADGVLTKPVELGALIGALRQLVRNSAPRFGW